MSIMKSLNEKFDDVCRWLYVWISIYLNDLSDTYMSYVSEKKQK